jgi:hypothetical protein
MMPMLVRLVFASLLMLEDNSRNSTTNVCIGVIEDAKFKRREALADLAAALAK